MKKHKKIVILFFLVIIVILGIAIYDNIHYSKKEILEIINRNDEQFENVYIKAETVKQNEEKVLNEIYCKDDIIYSDTYAIYENEVTKSDTEIWNLKTKEKTSLNHADMKIYNSKIRGKRISKSSYRYI